MNTQPKPRIETQSCSIRETVEHVAHLLPSQSPIRRFVHHNTLHAFEAEHFEKAVVRAGKVYNCEPFPSEEFFREQWATGRIDKDDLDHVLQNSVDEALGFGNLTQREFRHFRLANSFRIPKPAEVRFLAEEGPLLERCLPELDPVRKAIFLGDRPEPEVLGELWNQITGVIRPRHRFSSERRDALLERTIHPLLIQFCGAYLDQGIAYWPMLRQDGLYSTFLHLYSQTALPSEPWMRGLAGKLKIQQEQNWNAEKALEKALVQLKIPEASWRSACLERALSLKGWAGMVRQLEERPDRAPVEAPPCSLLDYLAVYCQLEAHLQDGEPDQLCPEVASTHSALGLAYEAFYLCQLLGLGPSSLKDESSYKALLRELRNFDSLERRRLLFLAYEHHYLVSTLDALLGHELEGSYQRRAAPRFQAVFCIDDREESLRRHLEELSSEVETLGYAGFFNIPMNYQSLDDIHSVPLCPVSLRPQHLIEEIALEPTQAQARANRKRKIGMLGQTSRANRTTVSGGLFLSSVAGFLAGIPLVGKTLAPGLFRRLEHNFEHKFIGKVPTRLVIERQEGDPKNPDGFWLGFTVEEMTKIVGGALKTMGAANKLASLFVVVGHGSSSLNNPHEAAHDCGATGGGRGGPNARAFAAMANHPEVRKAMKKSGFAIPETTWFIGAYHNTCDDTMTYYDEDLLPNHLTAEFSAFQELMSQACVLDAHERCRRFENVPLSSNPQKAFEHVLARAEQLAQPRPEYGHCTNSICIVGNRDKTRGVYLDRRAFLVSYDSKSDPDGSILGGILASVGPVGAGINLEYYFSAIDKSGYGCGTKLPHNITGLIGIMDGYSSDLRTGLPWQMVEIHEPMRLLNIVESEPDLLLDILQQQPGLKALIDRGWIHVVAQSPKDSSFWVYRQGEFQRYQPRNAAIKTVDNSLEHYQGQRGHLACAHVRAALKAGC